MLDNDAIKRILENVSISLTITLSKLPDPLPPTFFSEENNEMTTTDIMEKYNQSTIKASKLRYYDLIEIRLKDRTLNCLMKENKCLTTLIFTDE